MIPRAFIQEWRSVAPWPEFRQGRSRRGRSWGASRVARVESLNTSWSIDLGCCEKASIC
jgi:hypothetical protein